MRDEPEECLCRRLWFIVRTDFLFTSIHSHLKEKNIYYINTVLDLELVNNIKQSPLSQVGVYTTFFVYVSDFRYNSVAVDFRMRATWDM